MVRSFSLLVLATAVLGLSGCTCCQRRPAATGTAVVPGTPCPPPGMTLPPPPAPVGGAPGVRVVPGPPSFPGPGAAPTITPVPAGAPPPMPAPPGSASQFTPRLEPNWQPAEARSEAPRVAQVAPDPLLGAQPNGNGYRGNGGYGNGGNGSGGSGGNGSGGNGSGSGGNGSSGNGSGGNGSSGNGSGGNGSSGNGSSGNGSSGNAVPTPTPSGPKLYPPEVQEKSTSEPPLIEEKKTPGQPPSVAEKRGTASFPAGIAQFAQAIPGVHSGLRPAIHDGLDWLKERGYKTVLHLRAPGEADGPDRTQVEKLGMTYISLEVSPQTLTPAKVDEFAKRVRDTAGQPMFVYDVDGAIAGSLWYLYFRTVDNETDELALIKANRLGLRQDREGPHRLMWLATQKYLQDNP